MFEMDEGRISFADALRPPQGYEVSFAVGTTYTLDLRALLGICIPLGLGFEPEALDSVNPVSLFAALNRLQGKLAVYCDKGSMRADVPKGLRSSGLLMLLEGMVHQVHVNWRRKDALSSFHPKVWVVEYASQHGGDPLYRLLVMSRNLTFDTSWDGVASIDGRPGEGNACSEHLADFLEFLADGDPSTTTDRDDTRRRSSHTAHVRRLAQSIRSVQFDVDDRTFDSVDFLPFGPQTAGGKLMDARACELMTWRWRSCLVVSPFLSDGEDSPLELMARHRSGVSGRYVLLSREDSLASLRPEARDAWECFCPQPSLADVELDGEDGADASDYSNLHAKIYFTQDMGGRRWLYVGSLNASRNGTYNNVEALLRLGVRSGRLTFQQMLKPLIGDGGKELPPFSPYVPSEFTADEAEDDRDFRRAFRIASRLVSFRGVRVSLGDEGAATVEATVDVASLNKQCSGVSLSLRPLLAGDAKPLAMGSRAQTQSLVYEGIDPSQVSAFFVISGADGEGHRRECVTVCPHDRFDDAEASLEARSGALIAAILSEGGGMLAQYLAHAFDLPEAAYAVNGVDRTPGTAHAAKGIAVPAGLYERLLDMADTNPSAFDRASHLIELIPDEVREDELDALRSLVDTFSKAVS